ncbi:35525_t:CDS:2, partial [Racocetra persica]
QQEVNIMPIESIKQAFVFMSSKFNTVKHVRETTSTNHDALSFRYYKVVNQVDIVPTLSYLFGIPIPKNNLGKIMLDLLVDTNEFEKLRALQLNAHQLSGILQNTWISFDRDPDVTLQSEKNCDQNADDVKTRLQCLYWLSYYYHAMALNNIDENYVNNASFFYDKFISESGSYISSSFSDYDIGSMYWGLLFMGFATVCFIIILVNQNARRRKQFRNWENYHRLQFLSYLGAFGLCITMFSSSYVEEEHQFWYFWIQTMWLGFIIYSFRSSNYVNDQRLALLSAGQMILVRIIRIWNQTGQKYAGELDLRFYLNTLHGKNILQIVLQLIMILIILFTTLSIAKYKLEIDGGSVLFPNIFSWITVIVPITLPVMLARVIYTAIGITLILISLLPILQNKLRDIQAPKITLFPRLSLYIITYLLMLLSRPHNFSLYLFFFVQYHLLSQWIHISISYGIEISPITLNFILICLKFVSFFAFGNSNSLATTDISNSYIGITVYDPLWVGTLTFLANWTGPIWWVFAGNLLRFEIVERRVFINQSEKNKNQNEKDVGEGSSKNAISNSKSETLQTDNTRSNTPSAISASTIAIKQELKRHQYHTSLFQITTFYSLILLIISIAVTILKNHLFIWTVFSPKYLYQIIWYTLFLVGVEIVVGGVMWSMGLNVLTRE